MCGYAEVVRNFYSQTRIADSVDVDLGPVRGMVHGLITHGEQYLQYPGKATAYYCEGSGAGTLAVFGRGGDEMRMYEINDQVVDLAERHFSYLRDTPARISSVLGDGRLMLEREAPQAFDLLAVHITNTYLDLRPVMAAAAQHLGRVALLVELKRGHGDPLCRHSSWVVFVSPEQASALPTPLQDAEVVQY
jgi:hypothetical protein